MNIDRVLHRVGVISGWGGFAAFGVMLMMMLQVMTGAGEGYAEGGFQDPEEAEIDAALDPSDESALDEMGDFIVEDDGETGPAPCERRADHPDLLCPGVEASYEYSVEEPDAVWARLRPGLRRLARFNQSAFVREARDGVATLTIEFSMLETATADLETLLGGLGSLRRMKVASTDAAKVVKSLERKSATEVAMRARTLPRQSPDGQGIASSLKLLREDAQMARVRLTLGSWPSQSALDRFLASRANHVRVALAATIGFAFWLLTNLASMIRQRNAVSAED